MLCRVVLDMVDMVVMQAVDIPDMGLLEQGKFYVSSFGN